MENEDCYAVLPICDGSVARPVHSFKFFESKAEALLSAYSTDIFIQAIADLMVSLEYKCTVMYTADVAYMPPLPAFFHVNRALAADARDTVFRVLYYFTNCDVIPDSDRGWWHERLNIMLDDLLRKSKI